MYLFVGNPVSWLVPGVFVGASWFWLDIELPIFLKPAGEGS